MLALAVSVPIAGALVSTRQGLLWLGQQPEVAALAQRYNLLKLPTCRASWLHGRTLMRAATCVIWLATVVRVVLDWALIFGHLGSPR